MSIIRPTDEQRALREAVRDALETHTDVRALADDEAGPRWDPKLWSLLAGDMGLSGLLIPESADGLGGSVADAAIVVEECGAALAPVPMLSTVGLASPILRLLSSRPLAARAAKRIATETAVATIAAADALDPWSAQGGPTVTPSGTVNGVVEFVLDGEAAQMLLLPIAGLDGPTLCVVDRDQPGVTVTPMTPLDLTRGLARVELQDAEADVLGNDEATIAAYTAGVDLGLVLLAAEQVGMAQRCLDRAVAYAKERVQFGRKIGSFQAIKHLLVDLMLDIELARSAMHHAVEASDRHLVDRDEVSARRLQTASSAAAQQCKDAAMRAARETLHVFGGIGFTWEHDAHLYFRRAKTTEMLLGSPALHRARLVASLDG